MARIITISDVQESQFKVWASEHKSVCGVRPDVSGGLYYFIVFPSGLGDSITACCPCGAKQYLDGGEIL